MHPEPDIGQSSHPWNIYMQNIPSSKPYINCVKEFAYWQHDKVENMNILITNYFQYLHSLTLSDGKNQYVPTSLKSKYSINQFWKITGRGDLSLTCPIIEKNLIIWSKGYMIRKAFAFTKNQLLRISKLFPISTILLFWLWKYIASLRYHSQLDQVKHIWLTGLTSKKYQPYLIKNHRLKQSDPTSNLSNSHIISGDIEVNILDE